jgi:hypothetical protein
MIEFEGIDNEEFDIKISKDRILIRTIDNIGYPIDNWAFDRKELTKNEEVFISNIISMTTSMVKEKKN